MFRKLVVAYDGSPQSKQALDTAIRFTRLMPGLHICVLHVIKYPAYMIGEAYVTSPPSIRETMLNDADRLAAEAEARLQPLGVRYGIYLTEGYPADVIVEFAGEHHCDLILIGSRGHTGLKEWVLGSVSHNVVQRAKVPVYVVK